MQAHQRRRDTIPKPLPSSTRPLSALGLRGTAFSVLRYSFGNVSGIRLLAPRKQCRTPSALRLYLSRTDRTAPPRVRTGARRPFFGSRPRARLCTFPPHLRKNPRHGLRAKRPRPAGLSPAGRASQCVASQCVASQINSLSRQKHSGRNKPRLSRLLRKSRRSADRFHRNAVLFPQIGSSSELQPRRQKGRAARENKGRRSPIRRVSRIQSLRKRLLGQQSAVVFLQRLICQGFTPASALAGRNSQAKKRRQSTLCAGHPMSRPTGPHGGSAHPAALAETPNPDCEPSPKFADAASVF